MTVLYNTALGVIFGVKKYAERLLKVVEKRFVFVVSLNIRENQSFVDLMKTIATRIH